MDNITNSLSTEINTESLPSITSPELFPTAITPTNPTFPDPFDNLLFNQEDLNLNQLFQESTITSILLNPSINMIKNNNEIYNLIEEKMSPSVIRVEQYIRDGSQDPID